MEEKDLYNILGVSRSASQDEIKKAYRKLARKYHPDVNPGDQSAEQRFKEVSAAFDILGDAEKRKLYDEFGVAGLREGFDPEQARAYQQWTQSGGRSVKFDFSQDGSGFGGFGNLGDLFGDLFGGGRETQRSRQRGGSDIESEVRVDFLTAIRGGELAFSIDKPKACATCGGSGRRSTGGSTCPACQGTGQQRAGSMPFNLSMPCQSCGGSGVQPGPPCSTCGGGGFTAERSNIKVKIPAGIQDGGRIRLAGQGNPGMGGGSPGDLYLTVHVASHPLIRREGKDLYMTVPVTVGEAIQGANISIPLPDGGTVNLKVPKHSQNGCKLRLRGKGAPDVKGGQPGDLYVVIDVKLPSSKSSALESLAQEMERFYNREFERPTRL